MFVSFGGHIMVAKFNTKDTTRDYFQYVRKHALLLITIGVVLFAIGLAAGICALILIKDGIAGGIILLLAGILCGSILIIYGLYGLKRQLLSNTLITALDDNMTIFEEGKLIVLQIGRGIKVEKHYDYMHVAKVIENDDAYYVEMKDNNLVLCTKASLVEGDLTELSRLFLNVFGKNYLDHRKIKIIRVGDASTMLTHEKVAAIDEPNDIVSEPQEEIIEVSAEDIEEAVVVESSQTDTEPNSEIKE